MRRRRIELLAGRVAELEALLREVSTAGVEHDDPRIGYLTVQIDRDTWSEIKAAFREGWYSGEFSRRCKNIGEHGGTWKDSWEGSCAKIDLAAAQARTAPPEVNP